MNGKTMDEERLNELEQMIEDFPLDDAKLGIIPFVSPKEFKFLIAAARRCNELEAERDALQRKWERSQKARKLAREENAAAWTAAEQLRANNAALREVAERIINNYPPGSVTPLLDASINQLREALSCLPADSLREYRNGVLEEIDTQIQELRKEWTEDGVQSDEWIDSPVERILDAIRAMKEADNDSD